MPRTAQQIAFQEYVHAINDATERLDRLSQAVENALVGWKWVPVVRALMSLRGVQVLTGMTLVAEVGDFSRFDNARSLMHFFGLTPSEHSSGGSRVQGGITKCGNVHCRRVLTGAAWHYRLTPKISEPLQKRQEGQSKEVRLIAWNAQKRLNQRFKQLSAKKKSVIAAAAVARELTGFVWAIARQIKPIEQPAAPEISRTCRGKVYHLDPNKKIQPAK
ncbi:MAG TPA: transposase [Verrucomicrobiae bacterium]|jgi:transposase|nr:transposase [Verrucomicrobiae bacterium]